MKKNNVKKKVVGGSSPVEDRVRADVRVRGAELAVEDAVLAIRKHLRGAECESSFLERSNLLCAEFVAGLREDCRRWEAAVGLYEEALKKVPVPQLGGVRVEVIALTPEMRVALEGKRG